MPYTTTTREWFTTTAPTLVHVGGSLGALAVGPVQFDIEGDGGGAWTVDFLNKTVSEGKTGQPKVILRAFNGDFMALVEGRMTAEDGIVTKRLHLAGDIAAIAQLMTQLSTLRPQ